VVEGVRKGDDSRDVTTTPEQHDAEILSFERRWSSVSVLRCGQTIELHIPSSSGKVREFMHRFDGYLQRETSPDSDCMFRLAIAADLLIDELTISGQSNIAIAIGTTVEPPRAAGSDDFDVTGDSANFVVVGNRNGQRFAAGSFSSPPAAAFATNDERAAADAEPPRLVAISVDRASACVILGQRGLAKPEDFDDLLRSFNAAGYATSSTK
jgi:hypothetical protein